jgi:hypothetical protein
VSLPVQEELLEIAEAARQVALSMVRERGRGAVLVGVARVDLGLEALLRAALAPPRGRETLFLPDRPLGSFGARIALAARLGLVDAEVELALQNLRRLRNAFAHTTAEIRLGDPAIRQRLGEATRAARANALWHPLEAILTEHLASRGEPWAPSDDPGLRDFILLITILVAFLEATALQLRPPLPQVVMRFGGD